MKCSLGISNILEEISSLSQSIVFLYFFALITEEGFLISLFFGTLHSDGYIFPFVLCLSLLFSSQLFVRPPRTTIFPFLHFFSLGMVLLNASCIMPQTSIRIYSGTLSDLIPELSSCSVILVAMWDLCSLIRDQNHIPFIARQILNHWTTRGVLRKLL